MKQLSMHSHSLQPRSCKGKVDNQDNRKLVLIFAQAFPELDYEYCWSRKRSYSIDRTMPEHILDVSVQWKSLHVLHRGQDIFLPYHPKARILLLLRARY